jgi:hypothetical protein
MFCWKFLFELCLSLDLLNTYLFTYLHIYMYMSYFPIYRNPMFPFFRSLGMQGHFCHAKLKIKSALSSIFGWSWTMTLMVICLLPLMQKSCIIRSLLQGVKYLLVSYPGKPARLTYRRDMIVEPCHDKTNIMGLRPAWIQTSLRIHAVWSGSMLFAYKPYYK